MTTVFNSVDVLAKAYQSHPLADGVPPDWASGWGEDRFGVWVDISVETAEFRMRWIPPGEFLMGSPEDEPGRQNDETLHPVNLTDGYWLADTACTQDLWKVVMGENPSAFRSDDRPVEQVSWNDIQTFIQRLNEQIPDLAIRLPTEAEWEYAARAGTQTPYWWGLTPSTNQANYNGEHRQKSKSFRAGEYPQGGTLPAKSFAPNPWGLYQVHGNVFEWCSDRFGKYETKPAVDPQGPELGEWRVVRGGSWYHDASWLRAAHRIHGSTSIGSDVAVGFRLAASQSDAAHRARPG